MKNIKSAGVIATYNHEQFIERSVLSLASQVDEIVVVDDYSSDTTLEVLNRLKIDNLTVIANESNRGVSESFNVAVNSTQADFIFIQGGDDCSIPGRVRTQLRSFSEYPETVVSYSYPVVIDAKDFVLPNSAANEFFENSDTDFPLGHLYLQGNYICAPSVCLRRGDFVDAGGFNPSSKFLQDFDLWLDLADKGSFTRVENPVVKYRKHASNLSGEYLSVRNHNRARYALELEYILDRTIKRLSRSSLEKLALCIGIPSKTIQRTDREELEILVLLSSPQPSQVRRGIHRLMDVLVENSNNDEFWPAAEITNRIDELSIRGIGTEVQEELELLRAFNKFTMRMKNGDEN